MESGTACKKNRARKLPRVMKWKLTQVGLQPDDRRKILFGTAALHSTPP
jgi:hypothetical protein